MSPESFKTRSPGSSAHVSAASSDPGARSYVAAGLGSPFCPVHADFECPACETARASRSLWDLMCEALCTPRIHGTELPQTHSAVTNDGLGPNLRWPGTRALGLTCAMDSFPFFFGIFLTKVRKNKLILDPVHHCNFDLMSILLLHFSCVHYSGSAGRLVGR